MGNWGCDPTYRGYFTPLITVFLGPPRGFFASHHPHFLDGDFTYGQLQQHNPFLNPLTCPYRIGIEGSNLPSLEKIKFCAKSLDSWGRFYFPQGQPKNRL